MRVHKNNFCLILLLALSSCRLCSYEEIFEVSAKKTTVPKMAVVPLGKSEGCKEVAQVVVEDFNFTDQIDASIYSSKKHLSRNDLNELHAAGTSLVAYISETKKRSDAHSTFFEVKVVNAHTEKQLYEHEFSIERGALRSGAHKISSQLLEPLTGQKGIAASRLAYCKVLGKNQKAIFVADYDAKNEQVLVAARSFNVVPVWHSRLPLLFYSQLTNQNNRLMVVNINTKRGQVVSSFDGLNMQPSISKDGKRIALCLSCRGSSEIYLYDQDFCEKYGKRVFAQLTKNGGTNVSPCLLENGDLIFVSDFETHYPQIYHLNSESKKVTRLTKGGYAAAPAYCEKTKQLYYMRPVDGTFQIFRQDFSAGVQASKEEQITFSAGDKYNPAPSQCGRYVALTYRHPHQQVGKVAQIAVFNALSHKIRILTTGNELKSNPSWQPVLDS